MLNIWRKHIEEINNDRKDYLEQYKKDKEEKIYNIIKIYTLKGSGISHQDLANIVHMDRKSIHPYKQSLMKKKLIKENEKGKIVSTKEDYNDPVFNSVVMALSFMDLLKENRCLVLNDYQTEFL